MQSTRIVLSVVSALGALFAYTERAEAASSMPAPSGMTCWTTEQPVTLVDNEYAKLSWDQYGNLTLTNHMGSGSQQSWGIDSDVPLTGSNKAQLCFGNTYSRMRILDHNGNLVWQTGQYYVQNGVLSVDACTVHIKGPNGAVQWEAETAVCDRRKMKQPSADRCWLTSSAAQTIFWDEEQNLKLDWLPSGKLSLTRNGESLWTQTTSPAAKVCYKANGEFASYDASGATRWSLGSANMLGGASLEMDECGIAATYSNGTQYKRKNTAKCDRTTLTKGWCRSKGASGDLLSNDVARVHWTADGYLKLYNLGTEVWNASSTSGDTLCFQDDNNLVIYSGSTAVWASNTDGDFISFQPWQYNLDSSLHDLADAINAKPLSMNLDAKKFSLNLGGVKTLCDQWEQGEMCALPYDVTHPLPSMIFGDNSICSGQPSDNGLPCPSASAANHEEYSRAHEALYLCGCAHSPVIWTTPNTGITALEGGGFSFFKDLKRGNSDFGAELWILTAATSASGIATLQDSVAGTGVEGAVDGQIPASPASTWMEVIGDVGASATLFGHNRSIIEANAYLSAGSALPAGSIDFKALGVTVWNNAAQGYTAELSQELWSEDKTYWLEFIPVTVHAGVTGAIGIHLDYNLSSANVPEASETPYASLTLDASAGVGPDSDYSAGIEGELDLVTLSLPFTQKLTIDTRAFETTTDLSVTTLDGELDLYASFWPFKATKEIASWDGYSTSTNLVNRKGTLAF